MSRVSSCPAWVLLWAGVVIFTPGLVLGGGAQDDLCHQLSAGKIIVNAKEVDGTPLKCGEVMGVIDASPETVWQVITDINSYKYFMPRTLNSMAVAADKLPQILQRRPGSPKEVEQLLGPVPADTASSRVPGGKYTSYLYSHLNFPWPCTNRWYIIKILQDETRAAQHYYHSSWSLVMGNLRENLGEWILEPFDATRTKVTYRLLTDPGGAIPKFLVNRGTCTTLPQIISAVKKRTDNLGGRK
jgi:ribosome-associated toxin RatA of RatAB toxin-antitoxin module